jgi:hypothetical protein
MLQGIGILLDGLFGTGIGSIFKYSTWYLGDDEADMALSVIAVVI